MPQRRIEPASKSAAYEQQEAELVRSLEHTRGVPALLPDEPTTARDERNPVN